MGKPIKNIQEKVAQIKEILAAEGVGVEEACKRVGITSGSYYRHYKGSPLPRRYNKRQKPNGHTNGHTNGEFVKFVPADSQSITVTVNGVDLIVHSERGLRVLLDVITKGGNR